MQVYLAAPIFNTLDINEIEIVEKVCKELKLNFFSPRLETKDIQFSKLDKNSSSYLKDRDYLATEILKRNVKGILQSQLLIANTRDFDAGTIWEMGFAFANHIPIVSYTFKKYGLNIMLSQTVITHINSITPENYSDLQKILSKVLSLPLNNYDNTKLEAFRSNFNYINEDLE